MWLIYNAVDISRLIINHCIDIDKPINNITLVKLMYIIQYEYYIKFKRFVFNNDFTINNYGGYCEDVYREFRCNGILPIERQTIYKHVFYNKNTKRIQMVDLKVKDIKVLPSDYEYFKMIVHKYIDKDIFELVDITKNMLFKA